MQWYKRVVRDTRMVNFRDSLFKLEFIYSSSTGEEKGLNDVLATLNLSWSYLLYVQGGRMQLDSAEGTELA